MNSKGIALLSATALLAAGSATAGEMGGGSDIGWTYFQLGYVQQDGNNFFGETDGVDVMASIALSDNWHAGLSYSALSGDGDYYFSDEDIDTDTFKISVGYNAGLSKNSQGYLDLAYFDTELEVDGLDGGEGDSSGIQLIAGVRYQPNPKVELGASMIYTNGETDDVFFGDDLDYNDVSFAMTGQYFFVPEFSLGARAHFNGSSSISSFFSGGGDEFSIFFRYTFGGEISDMSDSSDASY